MKQNKDMAHDTLVIRGDIKWEGNEDDYTANIDGYCLRVEQMDRRSWWWCVYLGGDVIADSHGEYPQATTELEAKLLAEISYLANYNLMSRV